MVKPSIFHHSNLADPEVIGRVGRKTHGFGSLSRRGWFQRGEIRIMSHHLPPGIIVTKPPTCTLDPL